MSGPATGEVTQSELEYVGLKSNRREKREGEEMLMSVDNETGDDGDVTSLFMIMIRLVNVVKFILDDKIHD